MSTLDDDLGLVANGELTREELVSEHGSGADQLLELHEHLSQLSTVEIEPPPWYAVGPQLGTDPVPVRRRKRSVVVGIVAALVLIPATAEGIEAIAPDLVEGTVIDRITDLLPWDEDTPIPVFDRPDGDSDPAPITDELRQTDEPSQLDDPVREADRVTDTVRTTTTVTDRIRFVDRLQPRDRERDQLLPDGRRDVDPTDLTPEERERLRDRLTRERDGSDPGDADSSNATTTVPPVPLPADPLRSDATTTTDAARVGGDARTTDASTSTTSTTTTTSTPARDDDRGDRQGD